MTHKDGLSEPEAVKFLRETLTKRATSAEFNEWQARDIVAYIDDLVRRRTPANERGEPVAWRITFGDGSTWLRLTKAEVEEALASTNYDQVEVAPLYASPPSSPVAPEGVRVSYAKIIEIVNDCSERMKRSGESHRMLAKWVSEGINAALTPAAEQGETDMVLWKHDAPFITQVSQPDGKKFVSVAVRSFDALNEAHDLIVNAFKEAGAK
jgi:hypothetical protein